MVCLVCLRCPVGIQLFSFLLINVAMSVTMTAMSAASLSREKRQALSGMVLDIQLGVGANRETYLALEGGRRIVALTGFSTEKLPISEDQTIAYSPPMITVTGPGAASVSFQVKSYQQLLSDTAVLEEYTDESPGFPVANLRGCLYRDSCTAFFTVSQTVINAIEDNRPVFPALNGEVMVILRSDMTVQLNVDEVPDGIADEEDDILNLRGSMDISLLPSDALVYTNNEIRVRRRSSILASFSGVEELHVQQANEVGGVTPLSFKGDAPQFFTGPGSLYVGMNRDNQQVASFTNSAELSMMIATDLRTAQISYNVDPQSNTAKVESPLVTSTVIELTEADRFVFGSGTQIVYDDGSVMILDAQGMPLNLPAVFDDLNTLTTFFNNGLDSVTTGMASYNVPPGGVTMYVNSEDGTCFAYPSSDQLLEAGIRDAITNSGSMSDTMLVNLEFQPIGGLDQGVFVFNGVRTLDADHQVLSVSEDAQLSFLNGMLSLRTIGGELIGVYPALELIALLDPNCNIALSSSCSTFSEFDGNKARTVAFRMAGTLRIDAKQSAFFISNPDVDAFIIDILNSFPKFLVEVVAEEIAGETLILLQSEGITLLEDLESALKVTSGIDQRLIYFDNTVSLVDAISIPESAVLQYLPDLSLLQVVGAASERIFQQELAGPFLTRLFTDDDSAVLEVDPAEGNVTYRGGGTLYFGPSGAVYLPFNQIGSSAVDSLMETGLLVLISEDIKQLIFFRDGSFDFFESASPTDIPGGGRSYISNGCVFHTTDESLVREVSTRLSQLVPIDVSMEMGEVVISRAGTQLYTFEPTSSVFDLAEGSVLVYSGGNLEAPTAFLGQFEDIGVLVTYDGCEVVVLNSSLTLTLTADADGCLIVDTSTGLAFFTPDQLSSGRIRQFLRSLMETFIGPLILQSMPVALTSKLNEIEAGFGQFLTVYEGATVNLRCDAGNANPPANFSFSVRASTTNPNYTTLEDGSVGIVRDNLATLQVVASEGMFEYRCEASNAVGTVFESTRVTVRPRENPQIRNDFFAGIASPDEVVVSASDVNGPIRTVTPVVGFETMDADLCNTFVPVSRVSVGCKATGRPKPRISWFRSVGRGELEALDSTGLDFNLTSTRQGQSVLTVVLESGDTNCSQFVCVADNGGTAAEGAVEVCPQRFERDDSSRMAGDCSASCGIGVRQVVFQYQRFFNGTMMTLSATELPSGVAKPSVEFCAADLRIWSVCIQYITNNGKFCSRVLEYEFVAGEFDNCTEFCGGGHQTRDVDCYLVIDGVRNQTVDDANCTQFGLPRPDDIRGCNDRPCPSYYVTGQFGPCSRTCRGGSKAREVVCVMPVQEEGSGRYVFDVTVTVDLEICANFSNQVRPVETIPCNQDILCPVKYQTSEYGQCDEFSCQQRTVSCVTFNPWYPSQVWPTDISVCQAQGLSVPSLVRSCGGGVCSFGTWVILSAEDCSTPCGYGLQTQEVACTDTTAADRPVIEDGFCDSSRRPDNPVICFLRNCPGLCEVEPRLCPTIRRLRACRNPTISSTTQNCCKSCPLQATPIPPL